MLDRLVKKVGYRYDQSCQMILTIQNHGYVGGILDGSYWHTMVTGCLIQGPLGWPRNTLGVVVINYVEQCKGKYGHVRGILGCFWALMETPGAPDM